MHYCRSDLSQINLLNSLLSSTSARVDSAVSQISAEQLRALTAENALAINISITGSTIVSEKIRAQGVEASVATSIANVSVQVAAEQLRAVLVESSLGSSIAAEVIRAIGIENSLGTSIAAERVRAQGTESSIATTVSNVSSQVLSEAVRATAAEGSIANSLTSEKSRASAAETGEVARATSVEQSLSTVLAQTQSTLIQTQSTVVALISQQNSSASILARLNAIGICGAQGLVTDMNGNCVSPVGSSGGSGSGSLSVCAGNVSSTSIAFPSCNPGFAPSGSSTQRCASSSVYFPTTFSCSGKSYDIRASLCFYQLR